MTAPFVKTLTRAIETRLGGSAAAAAAAGISQVRWADWCNDSNPKHAQTTIPLHRFMRVAGPEERAALVAVLRDDEAPGECLNTEASEVTEAAAELQRAVREAEARAKGGPISKLDEARILKLTLAVFSEVNDVRATLQCAG